MIIVIIIITIVIRYINAQLVLKFDMSLYWFICNILGVSNTTMYQFHVPLCLIQKTQVVVESRLARGHQEQVPAGLEFHKGSLDLLLDTDDHLTLIPAHLLLLDIEVS